MCVVSRIIFFFVSRIDAFTLFDMKTIRYLFFVTKEISSRIIMGTLTFMTCYPSFVAHVEFAAKKTASTSLSSRTAFHQCMSLLCRFLGTLLRVMVTMIVSIFVKCLVAQKGFMFPEYVSSQVIVSRLLSGVLFHTFGAIFVFCFTCVGS